MNKEASEARAQRQAAAQRLIDKTTQATGVAALITGLRTGKGRVIRVQLRQEPQRNLAHT